MYDDLSCIQQYRKHVHWLGLPSFSSNTSIHHKLPHILLLSYSTYDMYITLASVDTSQSYRVNTPCHIDRLSWAGFWQVGCIWSRSGSAAAWFVWTYSRPDPTRCPSWTFATSARYSIELSGFWPVRMMTNRAVSARLFFSLTPNSSIMCIFEFNYLAWTDPWTLSRHQMFHSSFDACYVHGRSKRFACSPPSMVVLTVGGTTEA